MSAGKGLLSLFRKPRLGQADAPPLPPALPAAPALPPTEASAGPPLPPRRISDALALSVRDQVPRKRPGERPRLVFAVDATASRNHAWEAARKLTGRLFAAVPGELDVALAVHGGSRLHTFTRFMPEGATLQKIAAGVRCQAGGTQLLPILECALESDGVRVVVYIGDSFEESPRAARKLADALVAQDIRLIILHDGPPPDMFEELAKRTGGALLPFDISALERLGELLEAVAVVAVGGPELLEEKQETMPAAKVLLQQIDPTRLLIGRS